VDPSAPRLLTPLLLVALLELHRLIARLLRLVETGLAQTAEQALLGMAVVLAIACIFLLRIRLGLLAVTDMPVVEVAVLRVAVKMDKHEIRLTILPKAAVAAMVFNGLLTAYFMVSAQVVSV
jgi:hypothetical protein